MYGPGTAAVAAGAAGFEAVSAPEPVYSGTGLAEVSRAVVPQARSTQLPCTDDPELFFAESPEHVERRQSAHCAAPRAVWTGHRGGWSARRPRRGGCAAG